MWKFKLNFNWTATELELMFTGRKTFFFFCCESAALNTCGVATNGFDQNREQIEGFISLHDMAWKDILYIVRQDFGHILMRTCSFLLFIWEYVHNSGCTWSIAGLNFGLALISCPWWAGDVSQIFHGPGSRGCVDFLICDQLVFRYYPVTWQVVN